MSEVPEKPSVVEVRAYKELAYKPQFNDQAWEGRKGPPGLKLGEGMVRHLDVPNGWRKRLSPQTRELLGCDLNNVNIILDIEHTGIPVGKENAATFEHMLSTPPHKLDVSELAWLQRVLDTNEPLPGKISSARTYDIDDRRILETRSNIQNDKSGDERFSQSLNLYLRIDVPHAGKYLQKISYAGDPEPFRQYEGQAHEIFNSIKWMTEFNP